MRDAKILVVEDDDDIRDTLKELLEEEGYQVDTAANGEQALRRLRSEAPQIILLDLMMPVMDGGTALPKIREVAPKAAVVVLSVIAERDALGRMGADDADGYVEKGDFTTTADVLASVLERS